MFSKMKSDNKIPCEKILFMSLFCLILLLPTRGYTQELNFEMIKAAQAGDAVAVKSLLVKGADVNARDELTNTALNCAIQNNKTDCAITLLDNGAD
ncbi:MAG: ankyrin repeat domain-containing protein, partial [Desulfobacterales bacterium]